MSEFKFKSGKLPEIVFDLYDCNDNYLRTHNEKDFLISVDTVEKDYDRHVHMIISYDRKNDIFEVIDYEYRRQKSLSDYLNKIKELSKIYKATIIWDNKKLRL